MQGIRKTIEDAKQGQPGAVNALLQRIRPELERLSKTHFTSAPDASSADLVQNAWTRIWQRLSQFEVAIDDEQTWAKFRGWMTQTVRTMSHNARRDRNRKRRSPSRAILRFGGHASSIQRGAAADPEAGEATPSVNMQTSEQLEQVRAAIARINEPKAKKVVVLRFFQQKSLKEISKSLDITYDQARTLYKKAMQVLQEELGGIQ